MRDLLLAIALVTAGLAGCLGSEDVRDLDPGGASAAEERTLDAPPDLQVGEWWTIQVEGETDYATFETTIVVADRTNGTVTIGVPESDFADSMQIVHIPPLGSVDAATLSWHVMYDTFQPVTFPLEPGQEWSTQFHGDEVDAEVANVENGTAQVSMIGPNERINVTYDAQLGMVASFKPEDYGTSFEVTDHGFGYEGTVLSPTDKALGFLEFRAGALDSNLEPASPVQTVEIEREVSHASLALFAGSLAPNDQNAGVYRATATAPDGTTFEKTFTPTGSSGFMAEFYGHDEVPGTWELEFETGGPGFLGAELITFNLAEVTLDGDEGTAEETPR